MRVVDSSVWLEYFGAGPLAKRFEKVLEPRDQLLTPAIVVYEVYRWLRRHRGEEQAAFGYGLLQQTRLVPLDEGLAIAAAELSLEHNLAMADAIVYAAALENQATLVTSDAHFADLPGVEYHPKP